MPKRVKHGLSNFIGRCSIKQILLAAVLLGIVLPFGGTFVLLFNRTYAFAAEELMNSQRMVLYETAYVMEASIDLVNYSTTYVYLSPTVKNSLNTAATSTADDAVFFAYEDVRRTLTQIENSTLYPVGAEIAIVDTHGKLLTSETRRQMDLPLESYSWYPEVLAAGACPAGMPPSANCGGRRRGGYAPRGCCTPAAARFWGLWQSTSRRTFFGTG